MRLRRETGDFQIVLKAGETEGTYVANSIRPGLSAEDLIGEVVTMPNGAFAAIVSTNDDIVVGKVRATAFGTVGNDFRLIYDPVTGGITYIASQSIIPSTPGGNSQPTS